MSQKRNYRYLSWSEVRATIDRDAPRLKHQRFQRIIGVARGGMVPAVMLAHRLGVAVVETVQASSFTHSKRNRKRPIIILSTGGRVPRHDPKVKTLIVDDIVDSGATRSLLLSMYPGAGYWSLTSRVPIRSGCIILENSDWAIFPWEEEV